MNKSTFIFRTTSIVSWAIFLIAIQRSDLHQNFFTVLCVYVAITCAIFSSFMSMFGQLFEDQNSFLTEKIQRLFGFFIYGSFFMLAGVTMSFWFIFFPPGEYKGVFFLLILMSMVIGKISQFIQREMSKSTKPNLLKPGKMATDSSNNVQPQTTNDNAKL
ncbi:hypothetical protein [Shewanella khirikhana]|uniref:Transmembrane protein n=1 Tax=Shewanella khirikhana TaxID=1965282 RepID=A0ABM7DBW2_9GAMM|nr:hypothetical protein [Shewanella khirikhana]AZQ11259.1 hypothetical protein STH12_02173 [Shewanella khirikhana]